MGGLKWKNTEHAGAAVKQTAKRKIKARKTSAVQKKNKFLFL